MRFRGWGGLKGDGCRSFGVVLGIGGRWVLGLGRFCV